MIRIACLMPTLAGREEMRARAVDCLYAQVYLANPLLGAVGFQRDSYSGQNGCIIPVYIYGATHTYLVASQLSASASFLDNAAANHGVLPALLWE